MVNDGKVCMCHSFTTLVHACVFLELGSETYDLRSHKMPTI